MKESVFPDIDGAFTWYIATKDGLRLAHGRIAEDVAVERVYDLLCRIREKWCAAVPDFRGF
ncbi:MAG: hypothetical protein K9L82_20345 [Chromatiaceae bacterium]|nr:hypothetical protein [Chromatiaceae bacterium]